MDFDTDSPGAPGSSGQGPDRTPPAAAPAAPPPRDATDSPAASPADSGVSDPPAPARTTARATARWKTWGSIATGLFLVVLTALAVDHVVKEVDFREVWAYLDSLPLWKVVDALALTAAGYAVLTLYDVAALKYLKVKVPYPTVALASFCGYAISNNVGWAVISGGSVRFRVYSAAGLSPSTIAKVVVISTTTFTLGVVFTGSIGMLLGPHPVASLLSLPDWVVQAVAGAALAVLAVVCVISAVTRRPVQFWRWRFELPSGGIVLSQIIIASVEILISGAALWLLLPDQHGASFWEFLGIYCAALVVAMISHVPGGLGVFETILLLGLSAQGSAGSVLGALLAYRFLYYVVPLMVAGLTLLVWEARAKHGPVAAIRAWLRR